MRLPDLGCPAGLWEWRTSQLWWGPFVQNLSHIPKMFYKLLGAFKPTFKKITPKRSPKSFWWNESLLTWMFLKNTNVGQFWLCPCSLIRSVLCPCSPCQFWHPLRRLLHSLAPFIGSAPCFSTRLTQLARKLICGCLLLGVFKRTTFVSADTGCRS